jgi:hypothetical protein
VDFQAPDNRLKSLAMGSVDITVPETGFVFFSFFLIFNSENILILTSNLSCDWGSISVGQGDVSSA